MARPTLPDKKPPIQRRDYDLTAPPKTIADRSKRPDIAGSQTSFKTPSRMMYDMGFDPNSGDLTPLEFLVAVMNDDVDKIYRQKNKRELMRSKGIGMNYRVECAKSAAKFMHMAQPQISVEKKEQSDFASKLAEHVKEGNDRFIRKQMIIETVERVSPDMPLQDARYPPVFSGDEGETPVIEGSYTPQEDIFETDYSAPEGNTEYNPDEHD